MSRSPLSPFVVDAPACVQPAFGVARDPAVSLAIKDVFKGATTGDRVWLPVDVSVSCIRVVNGPWMVYVDRVIQL